MTTAHVQRVSLHDVSFHAGRVHKEGGVAVGYAGRVVLALWVVEGWEKEKEKEKEKENEESTEGCWASGGRGCCVG